MGKLPITFIDVAVVTGRHGSFNYMSCFVARGESKEKEWKDPNMRSYYRFSLSTLARLHRAQMKLAV